MSHILSNKNIRITLKTILVLLVIALLVCLYFLIKNIQIASRERAQSDHQTISQLLLKRTQKQALQASDVIYIDYWMTFRYLNIIFNLPDNYLREQLQINDPRYPNLSINRLASVSKIKRSLLVDQTRAAVSAYLNAQQH